MARSVMFYHPTEPEIIDAMLDLAGVTAADVVYDLGSGDGRIVIAAAQKRGARGVGIEIEAELVEQARVNARAAGVEDRVRFVAGDMLSADLGEASVVMLYLFPHVNEMVMPRLRTGLRPGARVVSQCFDMWGWPPDKTVALPDRSVYLWVIPPRAV